MAGRVAGKVALVTGAARGHGRAEAVRLAQEGADVVVVDVCGPLPGWTTPRPRPRTSRRRSGSWRPPAGERWPGRSTSATSTRARPRRRGGRRAGPTRRRRRQRGHLHPALLGIGIVFIPLVAIGALLRTRGNERAARGGLYDTWTGPMLNSDALIRWIGLVALIAAGIVLLLTAPTVAGVVMALALAGGGVAIRPWRYRLRP